MPSPLLAEIRALTRDWDRPLAIQQAPESQLRSILEAYHPAPARLFPLDRAISLSFVLDYPTPATASRLQAARIGCSAGATTTPAESRRRSWPSGCAPSCCPGPGILAGKAFSAQVFARLLRLLNHQLAEYDDAIAAGVPSTPRRPSSPAIPRPEGRSLQVSAP